MTVEIYRKRPLPVRAMQMDGSEASAREAVAFVNEVKPRPTAYGALGAWASTAGAEELFIVNIPTPEGVMTASPGDWVIQGVAGEFYPCKDEIFRKTYEPAVVEVAGH